ncbi:MAG TPA: PolC-type DNA polymerase III, partial [Clostridiaceae bacterium]|nr:PolC-type DNA polymerase III [Clostridiaceae bacterium]
MNERELFTWLPRLLTGFSADGSNFNIKASIQSVQACPQESCLVLRLLFSSVPEIAEIIRLEEELEKALNLSEVIIAQKIADACSPQTQKTSSNNLGDRSKNIRDTYSPQAQETSLPGDVLDVADTVLVNVDADSEPGYSRQSEEAKTGYFSHLMPWLQRHCQNQDALCYSWLQDSSLRYVKDRLKISVPANISQILDVQGYCWLERFIQDYAAFSVEIEIVQGKDIPPVDNAPLVTAEIISSLEAQRLERSRIERQTDDYGVSGNGSGRAYDNGQNNGRGKCKSRWDNGRWGYFSRKPYPLITVSAIGGDLDKVRLQAEIFDLEKVITKNGNLMIRFAATDKLDSISCRLFSATTDEAAFEDLFCHGYAELEGRVKEDNYQKELIIDVSAIRTLSRPVTREDDAPDKRVELHMHSKMSAKDGLINVSDIVTRAAEFGHSAVAITDHAVVQGFPEAAETAAGLARKGTNIKIIYGLEGYLLDDGEGIGWICDGVDISHSHADLIKADKSGLGGVNGTERIHDDKASRTQGFVALQIITSGPDPVNDRLISVAAIHFQPDGKGGYTAADEFSQLINPGMPLTEEAKEKTGLSDDILSKMPTAQTILPSLLSFIDGLPIIAHDALAQLAFLRYEGFRTEPGNPRLKFNHSSADTMKLAQKMLSGLSDYSLTEIAISLNIDPKVNYSDADNTDHSAAPADNVRAVRLAGSCGEVFAALLARSGCKSIAELNEEYGRKSFEQMRQEKLRTSHIVLLASDEVGLYNLYRLVSLAHLEDFYYRPRIRKSWLEFFGTGLIKGAACSQGEIFRSVLEKYQKAGYDYDLALASMSDPDILQLASTYDYLEVQPLTNTHYLLSDIEYPLRNEEDLKNLNRLVIELAKLASRPALATCDAHYLDQEDQIYRTILTRDLGFESREHEAELYFRTTNEMLSEFSYLDEELAKEIVINNPTLIAEQIKPGLMPIPAGSYPPVIEQAEEVLNKRIWDSALEIYGRDGQLPDLVEQRIKRELNSILDNGFAVMYYITSELVRKSNSDGYIVGSRGSVGSSLAATLCGITEVNPLPPHYLCPACHYTEFDNSGEYGSGYDLPAENCPVCSSPLTREGQDIPFETFLGFDGDKQPDIDLNFSGIYQPRAHRFIEEMFGKEYTFRAGTISGYAEKNSSAMVHNYYEEQGSHVRRPEVRRLASGISGVKRTTGQHPGGIVIVPRQYEVYDFTPIQYPADKLQSGVVTTHFDFNALHDTILKLDILGHDDPSMLKMLGDTTGVAVTSIPIPDPAVMSLFQSTEALGIPDEESSIGTGVIGLPEMGTFTARRMIAEAKPNCYYDLVQISGLSHGKGVWAGNAQDLIQDETCTLNDVIGCRDSIMTRLIYAGVPNKIAFDVMERVRKGKGLLPEQEEEMRSHNIPEWYIDSCQKIQYMFPKAHAVAYTISSLR